MKKSSIIIVLLLSSSLFGGCIGIPYTSPNSVAPVATSQEAGGVVKVPSARFEYLELYAAKDVVLGGMAGQGLVEVQGNLLVGKRELLGASQKALDALKEWGHILVNVEVYFYDNDGVKRTVQIVRDPQKHSVPHGMNFNFSVYTTSEYTAGIENYRPNVKQYDNVSCLNVQLWDMGSESGVFKNATFEDITEGLKLQISAIFYKPKVMPREFYASISVLAWNFIW